MAPTLLPYDHDCRFCRAAAFVMGRLLVRGGSTVEYAPLWSRRADATLGLEDDSRFGSAHLVLSDGRRYSRGRLIIGLLAVSNRTRVAARALERLGPALDRVYAVVASNRGRLSRLVPASLLRAANLELVARLPGA